MSNRLKYEIYDSDGSLIDSDIINSISKPLEAFAKVDWQKQLNEEIKLGQTGDLDWPAHIALSDDKENYLRIEPSPYGLGGSLQRCEASFKFGFIPEKKIAQTDFSDLKLDQADKLIRHFVLGNFEELLDILTKEPPS